MKLSEYAKEKGITYKTAWNWYCNGDIPNAIQMPSGTIIINETIPVINEENNKVVIYGRVSNASRKLELNYQIERIESFCIARGYQIEKIYKEVASGMNDNRKQLWKMLDASPKIIVVENKDRLTRFGFRYLKNLLKQLGTEIIVIHENESDETDLIKDLVSIITSFCCRLYGMRRGYKKAQNIKYSIENDIK
jgi:predicted site-specific integrase-resolvase